MPSMLNSLQLRRLGEHKYSAGGVSLVEPALQIYWRWLVEQVPLTWAPNSMTIAGLIINIVTTFVLVYYSPDAKQEAPRWAFLLCALGLFAYQSLDAIDGKQARRTNTSTPLGELFDHGCDSVSTVFVCLGLTIALGLGNDPGWLIFENMAAVFLFYLAHWQTYVSGTLRFSSIDVTEGQLAVIAIYILTAVFGIEFWSYQIPLLGLPMKMMPILLSLVGAALQIYTNFTIIFVEGGIGKNGATVADTSTIFPLLPLALVQVLEVMISQKSPSHLFEAHPCLYLLAFGFLAAKVTNRLVVAHMTKSEMDLWDPGLLGPLSLFLNQYFNCIINEYFLLWLCFIYCVYDISKYSLLVCQDICSYLNIYCFTITSRPPARSVTGNTTNGQSNKMR